MYFGYHLDIHIKVEGFFMIPCNILPCSLPACYVQLWFILVVGGNNRDGNGREEQQSKRCKCWKWLDSHAFCILVNFLLLWVLKWHFLSLMTSESLLTDTTWWSVAATDRIMNAHSKYTKDMIFCPPSMQIMPNTKYFCNKICWKWIWCFSDSGYCVSLKVTAHCDCLFYAMQPKGDNVLEKKICYRFVCRTTENRITCSQGIPPKNTN